MKVEVPAIEQRVSAVAAAVGARVGDVTRDVVGLITREIAPLRDDERVTGAALSERRRERRGAAALVRARD